MSTACGDGPTANNTHPENALVTPATYVRLAELGDTRRFQNSRDAVRYAGLEITVYQSDTRGHGPTTLAAQTGLGGQHGARLARLSELRYRSPAWRNADRPVPPLCARGNPLCAAIADRLVS
jgi:hypothetical protein